MSEFDASRANNFPYSNGTVWELKAGPGMRRVLTFIGWDWVLIGFGRSIVGYPCCVMNAQSMEGGAFIMKTAELPEKLKDWHCVGFWNGQEYPEVHAYSPVTVSGES